MTDLTKEEQAFFVGYEYWDETRGMQSITGGGDDRQPPCSVGCYNHVTHPCEKCGRLQGYLPTLSEGGGG